MGSGKTFALCRAIFGLSLKYPGLKSLIGRNNYTVLQNTTQAEWFTLIETVNDAIRRQLTRKQRDAFKGIGEFHKGRNEYTFTMAGLGAGSVVRFGPLEDASTRYRSDTFGAWGVDEASEVDKEHANPPGVLMLQARLRQLGMPNIGLIVSNPTPFDHWLYRWYGAPPGATVGPKGYPIFRARTDENAGHLPPGYVDNLRQSYPAQYVKRFLDGEWGGVDDGRPIFPTFDATQHVRTLQWHPRREVQVGIDLGTEAPGVVWTQIEGQTERLHVLRTWGPTNIDLYRFAAAIKDRTQLWFPGVPVAYYCGHDGGVKVPRPNAPALPAREVLREVLGVMPQMRFASKDRGFTTIRSLLERRDDGVPGLLIDPCNPVLIDGFDGGYRYDPKKEDEPIKNGRYDPLMDALRYIAIHRFTQGGHIPIIGSVAAFRGLHRTPSRDPDEPRERIATRDPRFSLRRGA